MPTAQYWHTCGPLCHGSPSRWQTGGNSRSCFMPCCHNQLIPQSCLNNVSGFNVSLHHGRNDTVKQTAPSFPISFWKGLHHPAPQTAGNAGWFRNKKLKCMIWVTDSCPSQYPWILNLLTMDPSVLLIWSGIGTMSLEWVQASWTLLTSFASMLTASSCCLRVNWQSQQRRLDFIGGYLFALSPMALTERNAFGKVFRLLQPPLTLAPLMRAIINAFSE